MNIVSNNDIGHLDRSSAFLSFRILLSISNSDIQHFGSL
jgi:hypothetical protein